MFLFGLAIHFVTKALLFASPVHDGPPVILDFEIRDSELILSLRGERAVLHRWLELDVDLDPEDPDSRTKVERALDARFQTNWRVRVDKDIMPFEFLSLAASDPLAFGGEPGTEIELRFETQSPPKNIQVQWVQDFGDGWENEDALPVHFLRFGRHEFLGISESEPECYWHARGREIPERSKLPAPHSLEEPFELPLMAIALILIACVAILRCRRAWRILVPSILLIGAFVSRSILTIPIHSSNSVAMPNAEVARVLFDSLHREVYQAFNAESEEDAYDHLARALDPKIIDEYYQRLFKAMILRNQGGAVCKVDRIEVLDSHLEDAEAPLGEDGLGFWIQWRWRVFGIVQHFGHEHRRTIEASARYWVRHDGLDWRIARADILEQTRLDD